MAWQEVPALRRPSAKNWFDPATGLWRVQGRDLKEEIVVNQAAREWIAVNRPPPTPATETYFGFVFQLDISDIPRWVKAGIVQDINGDFQDGGTTRLDMQDALSRALAFLPVSYAYSLHYVDAGGMPRRDWRALRTRIWKDGDGNHYLLVGARIPELNSIAAGPVTFDPTFAVAETNEDAACIDNDETNSPATSPFGAMYLTPTATRNMATSNIPFRTFRPTTISMC